MVETRLEGESIAWDSEAIAEPHPLLPKATARRGTRRSPRAVRDLVGPMVGRERAAELIAAGQIDAAKCLIVWNVKDRAISQPVGQMRMPDLLSLKPVRRIGTYHGAKNRIAMYPVLRGGMVTMLELESLLELQHAIRLSIHPDVEELFAQPFLMRWRHDEGDVVHVPDLAVTSRGRLTVFAVKPDRDLDDRVRALFDLVDATLQLARVEFRILGSVSKQQEINLARIARYRRPHRGLADLAALAAQRRPATIGGVMSVVGEVLNLPPAEGLPEPDDPALIGIDVAMYAMAHGLAATLLDDPLQLSSLLAWADSPRAGEGRE